MQSRIRRNLPPWNWLIRASQIINKFVCAFNSAVEWESEAVELEKGGVAASTAADLSSGNRYQADWYNAFLALHGVLMLLYSLIFIFGYLVIH
jgi:hypothetical protein